MKGHTAAPRTVAAARQQPHTHYRRRAPSARTAAAHTQQLRTHSSCAHSSCAQQPRISRGRVVVTCGLGCAGRRAWADSCSCSLPSCQPATQTPMPPTPNDRTRTERTTITPHGSLRARCQTRWLPHAGVMRGSWGRRPRQRCGTSGARASIDHAPCAETETDGGVFGEQRPGRRASRRPGGFDASSGSGTGVRDVFMGGGGV
jgi:hypothetical protein